MVLNKTIVQSAINAFIIAVLSQFLANGTSLFSLDAESAKALLDSGVVAALWVVFRYVNPSSSRFGYANKGVKSTPELKPAAKKTAAKKTTAKKTVAKKDTK